MSTIYFRFVKYFYLEGQQLRGSYGKTDGRKIVCRIPVIKALYCFKRTRPNWKQIYFHSVHGAGCFLTEATMHEAEILQPVKQNT